MGLPTVNFEGKTISMRELPSQALLIDGVWYSSRATMPAALQAKYPNAFGGSPASASGTPSASPSALPASLSLHSATNATSAVQKAEQIKNQTNTQKHAKACPTC